MTNFWIDANLILRFLTQEPVLLAERALRFFEQAEKGEITLHIVPLVVAEVVWVLGSFYKYSRTEICEVLVPFLSSQGLFVHEKDIVICALEIMSSANVDFVDAYLAETARQTGYTVASFDKDFRRLDISWHEPR